MHVEIAHVAQRGDLLAHCSSNRGVSMAEDIRSNTTKKIQEIISFRIRNNGTLAAN
jgi:hypothetical protein